MRSILTKLLIAIATISPAVPAIDKAPENDRPAAENFRIYDATLYANKPERIAPQVTPITVLYAAQIWRSKEARSKPPTRLSVLQATRRFDLDNPLVVLDIEVWPLRHAPLSEITESVAKLAQTLQLYRDVAPSFNFGFYGIAPLRNYHCAQRDTKHPCYIEWRNNNARLRAIIQSVDALFPSLYTLDTDKEGWVRYASTHISEARRLKPNLPVYVFLWPRYHDSNWLRKHTYIGDDYWRLQLETAREYADGVVIWGGWDFSANRRQEWNPEASWWRETLRWLSKL